MNILFVEDSEIILLNYKIMFVLHKNITIYSATTLGQAKSILSKEKINIMTLDISLPDGNGINFLKSVRQEFCDVYVIVMSCFLDEMVEKEAKKIGAYSCLDKGDCDTLPTLVSEISDILAQQTYANL